MSFNDEERAELIAALSRTAEMVGLLLDALDVLLVSYVAGQQPSAGDVERLTEHSALWRLFGASALIIAAHHRLLARNDGRLESLP